MTETTAPQEAETTKEEAAGNESGVTHAAQNGHGIDEKVIQVAKQTMVGDLRDVCLQIMRDPKLTGKAWKDMKEAEQKEVVQKITDSVTDAVVRGVQIIAANGQRQIIATLEQVVIKDGVKAVLKCSKYDELLHNLVDAEGDAVAIVLTGAEEFVGTGEKPKIDKDQKELPVDANDEPEPETGEEADVETDEDYDEETGEISSGLEQEAAALT